MDRDTLAGMIDQTLLRPTASVAEGRAWLDAQRGLGFATVCVTPALVAEAARAMDGTATVVCSVVGFPLGYDLSDAKAFEAAELVAAGATEIDMVLRIGDLLAADDETVTADITRVVAAVDDTSGGKGLVKVILETGYLQPADIERGCRAAEAAGAAFVKTSTGFGPRGASAHDVHVMRTAVGERLGVKAAGGIRTLADALAMIEAGATRIGTSAGAEIVSGFPAG